MTSSSESAGRSPGAQAESGTAASGTPVHFEIPSPADDGSRWRIEGELRIPAGQGPRTPATVQVLIPGLTYDRRYWTAPGPHDYAGHMTRAGYAVLAFDRLGTGASSHPPADQVTADAHVAVLHHIIQALRTGDHQFEQVITVGHSFGSGIAIMEAARHHDADGVLVSGMLHAFTTLYDQVTEFFHPAVEDPVIASADLPEWYMTQRPGRRATMLEYPDGIDSELSAHNEFIKSTATLGEGLSLPETYKDEYSSAIDVPVLIVVGQHDALFCGEAVGFGADEAVVHAYEEAFYKSAESVETRVIPNTGHALNLHRSAGEWFGVAQSWADRHMWAGSADSVPQGCAKVV